MPAAKKRKAPIVSLNDIIIEKKFIRRFFTAQPQQEASDKDFTEPAIPENIMHTIPNVNRRIAIVSFMSLT